MVIDARGYHCETCGGHWPTESGYLNHTCR